MSHRPLGINGVEFNEAMDDAKLAITVVPGDKTD